MTMKHFDTDFFTEIINGMKAACGSLEVQQLLSAATSIYLASGQIEREVKEGQWKIEGGDGRSYQVRKIVECPFCKTRRAVFMGDTLKYCNGCGAKMEMK